MRPGPVRGGSGPHVTRRRRLGLRDQGGSASLLVAFAMVVFVLLAAVGIVLTSVLATRATVAAAADLAVLAGASSTLESPDRACARAGEIAARNGARLADCQVRDTQVWVSVTAPAPRAVRWLFPERNAVLRARAHAELTAEDP
ncbi:MAG: Rv3654c family TadE-like protein [Candidatus Nanopelagicales bacterium]